ncbi:MAG: hypothetical protein ACJA0X_001419 [Cyclobacteriaceae bacterium]|jgi:hypothetical protein
MWWKFAKKCDSSSNVIERFENRRVELAQVQGSNLDYGDTVILVDQMKDWPLVVRPCSKVLSANLEVGKVIEVTGNLKSIKCQYNTDIYDSYIEIDSLNVIDHCLPVIDTIQSQNDLFGEWLFYEIHYENEIYLPACEAGNIGMNFIVREENTWLLIDFGRFGTENLIELKDESMILRNYSSSLGLFKTENERLFFRTVRSLTNFQADETKLK